MTLEENNLVSICVPTYNRSNLIAQLLDSILSQTYQEFEIIITDNSDNTETEKLIFDRYSDHRVKYFKNEKNIGMGGNTLKALSKVTGAYFTFTPDDDVWIDQEKLQKQVDALKENQDIDIIYSNAQSMDYTGNVLEPFASRYNDEGNGITVLCSSELLPGVQTQYFLNILTPVIRASELLEIFKESWHFDSEEYFCYYLSATNRKIGFLSDITVALREGEHYRTTIEDGKVVDWKKRKDIRIRQIFGIYTTLTTFHPQTKVRLESAIVHNALAKHVISSAKSSKSLSLLLATLGACYLHFRKFSLVATFKLKSNKGKSFG